MRSAAQPLCLRGERGSTPLRGANGKACTKGASCTCNAAAVGSIPILSTKSSSLAFDWCRLVLGMDEERVRFPP